MAEKQPTSKKRLADNKYLKYSGLGFQLIGALLFGLWLGKWLDKKFETAPYLLALCLLLSLGAGMYLVIKDLIKK